MAFHVACPITCERICYCELGFPARLQGEKGRREFLEEVSRVEEFVRDPWWVKGGDGEGTVQVLVPTVVPPPAAPAAVDDGRGGGEGDYVAAAQTKRAALQRQAAAASVAAEDYVRRLEAGELVDGPGEADKDLAREDQAPSTVVICRICFSGENEGSDKAMKMLPCKTCNKKYHRSCLKSWAENRDLFHWSSWACPSCRICEVCRRAGDPSKFMFCKRCDAAYHCYCQQPPHKNVSRGPYLCPKHTRCHSCRSSVPGSGPSTRWFLCYTCCDACGRLFVKGNYCPVCLKVYRDSEATPMVCCDDCQRWVHCACDGISDEKYQQFQADGNLYYRCAACRGDCYQAKDIDDAVQELWRRRDKADRDLIARLRAAAGLPYQEDIFSISPFSDDEESGLVVLKGNHGRSLKFSVKGLADKVIKSAKEYDQKSSKNSSSNKKHVKKKAYNLQFVDKSEEPTQSFGRQNMIGQLESSSLDGKNSDEVSFGLRGPALPPHPTPVSSENMRVKTSVDLPENEDHIFRNEIAINSVGKVSKVDVKNGKPYGLHPKEGSGKLEKRSEPVKGPKLVIHLGPRKNVNSSPRSEASSCHREHDLAVSNGSEASSQQKMSDKKKCTLEQKDGITKFVDGKGAKFDDTNELKVLRHREKETIIKKLEKDSRLHAKINRGSSSDEYQPTVGRSPVLQRLNTEGGNAVETADKDTRGYDEIISMKNSKVLPYGLQENRGPTHPPSVSETTSREPKPLLKLKFKNLYVENRSAWVSQGEERNSVKGQRSKRKRPSPSLDKVGTREGVAYTDLHQVNMTEEVMDANWILQKLGKDAIGKRVEIHRQSDSSWHEGAVSDVIEGTSSLLVRLDDGRTKTLELGKQGIRFISQKKRTKL